MKKVTIDYNRYTKILYGFDFHNVCCEPGCEANNGNKYSMADVIAALDKCVVQDEPYDIDFISAAKVVMRDLFSILDGSLKSDIRPMDKENVQTSYMLLSLLVSKAYLEAKKIDTSNEQLRRF